MVGLLMPLPLHGRFWSLAGDLAHGPLFMLLAFCGLSFFQTLYRWWWAKTEYTNDEPTRDGYAEDEEKGRQSSRPPLPWWSAIALTVCIIAGSAVTEYLQQFSGRKMAMHDLHANAMGAAAGLIVFLAIRLRRVTLRCVVFMFAFAIVLYGIYPALRGVWDCIAFHHRFPRLASFESRQEKQRWYYRSAWTGLVQQHVTDGDLAMRVDMVPRPEDPPGMTLVEGPHDWSHYRYVEFDVCAVLPNPKTLQKILQREHPDWNESRIAERLTSISTQHSQSINVRIRIVSDLQFAETISWTGNQYVGDHSRVQSAETTFSLKHDQPRHMRINLTKLVKQPANDKLDTRYVRYFELRSAEPKEAIAWVIDNVHLSN